MDLTILSRSSLANVFSSTFKHDTLVIVNRRVSLWAFFFFFYLIVSQAILTVLVATKLALPHFDVVAV